MKSRSEAAKSSTSPSSSEPSGDPLAFCDDLEEGESFGLTVGPETYFPVRFNGFAVGPITRTTTVRPGETGRQAYARLKRFLEGALRYEFETGERRFRERRGSLKAG